MFENPRWQTAVISKNIRLPYQPVTTKFVVTHTASLNCIMPSPIEDVIKPPKYRLQFLL